MTTFHHGGRWFHLPNLIFFCVFALLVVVCTTTSFPPPQCVRKNCEPAKEPKSNKWDYLQLVVQWPQSFCLYFNNSRHGKHCHIPNNIRNWTIHGLWPTKTGVIGPQYCNSSWPFNLNKINDLVPEMNQIWPNLKAGQPSKGFWGHEWEAHGTCCADLPALHGEHNYFRKTMDLKHGFNIDNVLSAGGIVPSQTAKYSVDAIMQAIHKATGTIAAPACFFKTSKSKGTVQYLAEIRLCLDKTLKPRDCPKPKLMMPFRSGIFYSLYCNSTFMIALPPIE